MKRTLSFFLSALFLICLFTGLDAAAGADDAFVPQGSVLFEKDGIKVTTAGADMDPTSGDADPIIWVDIENTADHDAYLGVSGGCVNGISADVLLIDYYKEDGQYFGADYEMQLTIPAHSSGRYALGYYKKDIPGVHMSTLAEMEFSFTLAKEEYAWPDYCSEPVKITTGESGEGLDIASLGTVVLDNDTLRLVIGRQDYDDWMGPLVYVYAENKTDRFIGLDADAAEADGSASEDVYYSAAVAPFRSSAEIMSFGDGIGALKGFENLSVRFTLRQSDDRLSLDGAEASKLEAVSVQYPPQIWGEYENAGLRLEIQPRINELVTVETPADSADGTLFTVFETASREADDFEGVGWLFSIERIDEDKLHELLCYDLIGMEVFARDEDGNYYVYCHPTDVRYARRSTEEMQRDIGQWTMLCEWADGVPSRFVRENELEDVWFNNTEVDMLLARAAWKKDANVTLSTTEYGPVEARGVDAAPYMELLRQAWFTEAEGEEAPDGEYVVLNIPDEDTRLDFFFAPGAYVRVVTGESERLYQTGLYDDNMSLARIMQDWYYAAAEKAGVRTPDDGSERGEDNTFIR